VPARVAVIAAALLLVLPASANAAIQPGDPIDGGNCTLGWLFDGNRGQVFFATAAHCVKDGAVVHLGGALLSGPPGDELGTVRVRGDDVNPETDVALIEVREALRTQVAGELRGHPGVPVGVTSAATAGDLLQLSGWGLATEATEPTREDRQGVVTELTAGGRAWRGVVPVSGGDSGGPVAHVATGGAFGLVGEAVHTKIGLVGIADAGSAVHIEALRVAAAEAENVSRAALKLHVSQPALSRQIRDLEWEVKAQLLIRGPRGIELTAAGRAFLALLTAELGSLRAPRRR